MDAAAAAATPTVVKRLAALSGVATYDTFTVAATTGGLTVTVAPGLRAATAVDRAEAKAGDPRAACTAAASVGLTRPETVKGRE